MEPHSAHKDLRQQQKQYDQAINGEPQGQAHRHNLRGFQSATLAPELILHILSFLGYHDKPSVLWPILTLCKHWARLALELIYDQPIVDLRHIHDFVSTLVLQDRLHNGQSPFWDTPSCATAQPSSSHNDDSGPTSTFTHQSLGIDYRALIKKPCRIVGAIAPVKQDLIQLWDLQALLWTAPAFARIDLSETCSAATSSTTLATSVSTSGPLSPPLPTALHTTLSPSSSPDSQAFAHPSSKSPSSPTLSRAVVVRRKKKSLPPPGPLVLLLEVSPVLSDIMHYILREVPGMKLRRLHYKWLLSVPLLELLELNLTSLRELIFSRPPTRQDEFIAIAQLLAKANHISMLKFDHCQAAGNTVLTQFALSCGASLETLEIRQHVAIRPMGDHAIFPVDGPEDWNSNVIIKEASVLDQEPQSCPSGQECPRCRLAPSADPNPSIESVIDFLSVSEEPVMDVAEPPIVETTQDIAHVEMDMESRMDQALKAFGLNCPRVSRLRLQHLTWLSDDSLAAFAPSMEHTLTGRGRGLKEIEILDSYYGSQVTVEGVLDLCGPSLEALVLDRKSCWRGRTRPGLDEQDIPPGLCSGCNQNEKRARARIARLSTGDRLITGLMGRGAWAGRIRQLETLVLIEHWVSLDVLKEALQYWRRTLRVLTLRLFKCSIEGLTETLVAEDDMRGVVALENLTLGLPWVDVDDGEVVRLTERIFDSHSNLDRLEINKRIWRREDMNLSGSENCEQQA